MKEANLDRGRETTTAENKERLLHRNFRGFEDSNEETSKPTASSIEQQKLIISTSSSIDKSTTKDGYQREPLDFLKKQPESQKLVKMQGDIGEGISLRVASDKLNLAIADPRFDQKGRGFDGVFHDKGKIVVIESKFTKNGKSALNNDQGQPAWVERTAKKMMDEKSELYSEGNKEIGREILKTGSENIRRILISINPGDLKATTYEGQPDLSWKKIGEFDVYDLDQPYLE